MNIILGGGLIGLLAKEILGPDWFIVPHGRSRYYSSWPPIGDNFIAYHNELASVFDQFCAGVPRYLKKAVSYSGALVPEMPIWAKKDTITHVFGDKPHPLAGELLCKGHTVFECQAKTVCDTLIERFHPTLVENTKHGRAIRIDGNRLITEHGTFEFEKLISTVPLPRLYGLLGVTSALDAGDLYVYTVETHSLDLEGASQVYVADNEIPFFKVNVYSRSVYQFYTHEHLGNVQAVLGAFTNNKLSIRSAVVVRGALPLGAPPDLGALTNRGIECVGAEAQWDYFMDIGACARKLLRIAGR
jgi:hypothetical protein